MQFRIEQGREAFLAFAGFASALAAQWTEITPLTRPPKAAPGELMEYDSGRDRIVLQVGKQTWEFDGTDWSKRADGTGPDSAAGCMAFDSVRGRMVLFDEAQGTWEWDGAAWTKAQPALSPSARAGAMFAFDAQRRRCLLFGGLAGTTFLRDTWEWDGTSWTERKPVNTPTATLSGAMAYDAARARIVAYAGFLGLDHWEWDGTEWTRLTLANKPVPVGGRLAMVYDSRCNYLLLLNPNSASAPQLWAFRAGEWQPWTDAVVRAAATPGVVYDDARRRVVLWGGSNFPSGNYDDTWQLPLTTCAPVYGSVFPAAYVQREGEAASSVPFTLMRARAQFAFSGAGFGGPSVGRVTRVDFRRDRGVAEHPARAIDCQVSLGAAAQPPARMSMLFDANWNQAPNRIHTGVLALPANPPAPGGIAPFSISIPCAQPYVWNGEDLVLELVVRHNTLPGIGSYEIDAVSSSRAAGGLTYFGQSCRGRGGEPQLHVHLQSFLHPGGLVVSQIHAATPGAFAVSFLGSSNTSWNGVPLPFTWPQTTCSMFTGPELALASMTDPSGASLSLWHLPADPVLDGAVAYHQWAVLEPTYAYPPFAMSRAAKLTLAQQVAQFETVVNLDPAATFGIKDPTVHVAPVVRLIVQ